MLLLRHKSLLIISGLIWLAVGTSLMSMGFKFLFDNVKGPLFLESNYPLLQMIAPSLGGFEKAAMILAAVGLGIGYMKGNFVLGKSAKRGIERIQQFPNPTPLSNIYSAKYYILLGVMVGLGMSIKYLGVPLDVRGFIDVIIGAALIKGSMFYFRAAFPVCSLA